MKQVKLWFYKLAAAGLAASILIAGQHFPKVLTQSCSGMVKKEKCQNKPKTATLYELHKKATILKKTPKNLNLQIKLPEYSKFSKNSCKTALQRHAKKSRKNLKKLG